MKVRIISTVKEFREFAKNNGYRGYSRLKKEELRKLISKPPPDYNEIKRRKNEERRQRGEYTRKELDTIAKNAGLRGYSKLKKDDLNEKLRENYILSSDILDVQEPARTPRHPFKIRKTASALNRFTNQYAIEGHAGYDPNSFLDNRQAKYHQPSFKQQSNKSCVSSSLHDGENKLANGRNSGERSSILVWCRS